MAEQRPGFLDDILTGITKVTRPGDDEGTEELSKQLKEADKSDKEKTEAEKKLDNYLRNLGFTSGRNDGRAPTYTLFQQSNGKYVYRLDDTEENKIKLGNYFIENPNQRPLTPTEGDLIIEGRNGQRFRATMTGPEGKNTISNNVTDVEDDNTSIGDSAILISVG